MWMSCWIEQHHPASQQSTGGERRRMPAGNAQGLLYDVAEKHVMIKMAKGEIKEAFFNGNKGQKAT